MPTLPRNRDQLVLALLAVLVGSWACSRDDAGRLDAERVSLSPAAADDPEGRCQDLGAFRVCWSARCPDGICTGPRPLPAALMPLGSDLRCTGAGPARRCRPRSQLASSFHCREHRCYQEQPRLPDDGEWECADLAGIVICRGGAPAAGVAGPNVDPGWICGPRRNSTTQERICLDLDADLPTQERSARSCRFEVLGARLRRVCESKATTRFGDPCSRDAACPEAGRCVRGVCLPPRVDPDCWNDFDCGEGRCSYGSCGALPR